MKNIILVLLSFFLFSNGHSQALTGRVKFQLIDNYIKALVKNQDFSGNVLVIENDEIVYQNSFGYADFPKKMHNTDEIHFPIASISKILTATAILQLKEKGVLKIEDKVSVYLPDFPYKNIAIKHLLSHTSGLPPYNAYFDKERNINPDKVFTNDDFIKGLVANSQPLIYEPGEKSNYDNINYIVLALIIEKTSGLKYEEYIKRNILSPAEMLETYIMPLSDQFNIEDISNFSFPHIYLHPYDTIPIKSNSIPYVKSYWHSYRFKGFGDYVSTLKDLWKLDVALYSEKILKNATLSQAYNPVILNNGEVSPDRFGLGWEIEKDSTFGKVVYHSGAAMGLSSNILRNINKHQTVILFDNSHFNAHHNAYNILLLLNGVNIDMPKKSLANIYGKLILKHRASKVNKIVQLLKKDTAQYYLSEDEMNTLGYDFLASNNPYHLPLKPYYKKALETFKTNIEFYPYSWNVYDSYADALLANGKIKNAIRMYKKSLEINPNNENGKKVLKTLLN